MKREGFEEKISDVVRSAEQKKLADAEQQLKITEDAGGV